MKHERNISGDSLRVDEVESLARTAGEKSLDMPSLSVIIPLRITEDRTDLVDRIFFCLEEDTELPEQISFLVVDDGSRPQYFDLLCDRVTDNRISVISTGRKHYQPFNIGHARNCGAQRTSSEYVLFLDADLVPYPGFFRDILCEIRLMKRHEYASDFLMCPVIYLTETGYRKFQDMDHSERRQFFINALLRFDTDLIEKYSTGTSATIIRRDYFLARGGNDTRFSGWGYEDYEFTNRLIRRSRKFPLSEQWLKMDGNFMTINHYEGWKAVYRLQGDWLAQKGIWLFHAPHAVDRSFHYNKDRNWSLLQKRMKEDVSGLNEPPALPDLTAGRSLFLADNPFCRGREIAPYFGEAVFALDTCFTDQASIRSFIRQEKIDRVVFSNPYKDESAKMIYDWCRKKDFPFVVCERGALPDSVFHDRTGFLTDGESFHRERWDHPLSMEEIREVEEYAAEIRWGTHMLEQQTQRADLCDVRRKLGIRDGQKVLLVPFQQPNDTVIRHFCGPVGSFENFYDLVCSLPEKLGSDWHVLYKKHPVEDRLAPIPGATCADDINLYDLIEICDAMLVINSGTGIYGMMFGKPVYIVGESWYADERINVPIIDIGRVADAITGGFDLDYDLVLRFLHYLRFKFYSFGEQMQRRVRYDDGSPITATTEIRYYEVRGFTESPLYYRRPSCAIPRTSLLFDRYRTSARLHGAPTAEGTNRFGITGRTPGEVKAAKWNKLWRHPYAFFRDARVPMLRPIRYLFARS